MIVYGNIASQITRRIAKGTQKPFYTFRLAENQGQGDQRVTTWYDVSAFISELDADMLAFRQFIKVSGRLDIQAYKKRDGEPGASATILAFGVEAMPTKGTNAPEAEGASPRQASEPRQAYAPRPAQTPAPRQAPAPRPASGFDDMDDDIPF